MLPVQCEEIYSKLYMTALNIQRQKNVTGETGGEGFCSRCVRGELIAQRSRTVHELDDREVLGLQIRGTTGGCVDTYTWADGCTSAVGIAGCMQVRLFDGMWGLLA